MDYFQVDRHVEIIEQNGLLYRPGRIRAVLQDQNYDVEDELGSNHHCNVRELRPLPPPPNPYSVPPPRVDHAIDIFLFELRVWRVGIIHSFPIEVNGDWSVRLLPNFTNVSSNLIRHHSEWTSAPLFFFPFWRSAFRRMPLFISPNVEHAYHNFDHIETSHGIITFYAACIMDTFVGNIHHLLQCPNISRELAIVHVDTMRPTPPDINGRPFTQGDVVNARLEGVWRVGILFGVDGDGNFVVSLFPDGRIVISDRVRFHSVWIRAHGFCYPLWRLCDVVNGSLGNA